MVKNNQPDNVLPLFAPTGVILGPVPTEITVARLTIEGRQVVGMQVVTPTGVQFYFMDPDQAKKTGQVLQSVAGGIIVTADLANAPAGVERMR